MNDYSHHANFKLYNVVLVTKTYFPLSLKNNLKKSYKPIKSIYTMHLSLNNGMMFQKRYSNVP